MEMLHAGVFNAWTEKSLNRLAEMVPGRYAKNEMSSGFIGAIDHYAYRSPLAQAASQTASNAGTTPSEPDNKTQPVSGTGATPSKPDNKTQPAPTAVNQGAVKHANPQ